jgi:hypothetical protein
MKKILILLWILMPCSLMAQLPNNNTLKLNNPRQTMRTFLEAMERVKKGDSSAINEAIITLDLSNIDPTTKILAGKISAERLINTIDRISKIDYSLIPNYENGAKWYFRKQTISLNDKNYDVEIALAKTSEGQWKFSTETIATIENFYSSVAHHKIVDGVNELTNWKTRFKNYMPKWMSQEFFLIKNGQWIALIVLLIISLIVMAATRRTIRWYFSDQRDDRKSEHISTLPFGLLGFSLVWFLGVRILEFDVDVLAIFFRGSYVLIAFSAVWSSLHLVDFLGYYFEKKYASSKNKFDDVL